MTSTERSQRRRERIASGLVLVTLEVPAALRADIEAMADRMVKEWEARERQPLDLRA